ncbi:ABC transporter ATP-binding protein [Rhodocyclus tenuis]|uniref:ABC transporter ATP-binding protein n=2 Tax=Rhodocyclus TaxID=1064 RepID=A0A6L5JVN5_RHOTE|nr:ABC transporter ATP-binding protein [Rhodocyclus gracilis]MQY51435.1 ABC transporter ATP-binding protein [Rhodocyclus gracilis]MRD72177.1 ABC transporter ATP-binding protein [Rhodocyclus gracilis]NJA89283.1 ABC transporter ATP-binding protein [Rhodocyclus gracilis]
MIDFAALKRDRRAALAATAGLGVLLALAPFLIGAAAGATWLRILDFALLYIMLALGLNIVVGFAGLLDMGYIAFYGVGAYLYALLASPHFGLHWPVWAILPTGALVAGLFGVLLGAPTLRLRGDYLAIVTLGFGEIIRIFLNNLNAPINITNGPQGISGIDPIHFGSVSLAKPIDIFGFSLPSLHAYYYLFLLLALGIVFVTIRLENSRIGRAWVAIREDEIAAKACGINTRNIKLLAFAMGASFGGVAGGLFAGFQAFVSPESFSLMESVMVLCMVVLGGMGNIFGVILGGALLTILPEVFRHSAGPVQQAIFGKVLLDPEALRMLLFGLALIVVMLYRPAGLWPSTRRRQEFKGSAA